MVNLNPLDYIDLGFKVLNRILLTLAGYICWNSLSSLEWTTVRSWEALEKTFSRLSTAWWWWLWVILFL